MRTGRRRVPYVITGLAVALQWIPAAFAQAQPMAGPSISLGSSSARVNDRVLVQLRGWESGSVTLAVCGNLARRGSTDCNMVGSDGIPVSPRSPEVLTEFTITAPPATCPCVIRGASPTQDEVAFAPLEIVGHPTGPLVGPRDFTPLEVSLEAHRLQRGVGAAVRSSLGGPASYTVSVVVRNRTAESVPGVRVHGWGGRSRNDQARALELPDPGDIGPGDVWRHAIEVDTPAPYLGEFFWQVSVSGAGPTVRAEAVSRNRPWLLVLLVVVLVADVAAIGGRRLRRWREERDVASLQPTSAALTT